MGINGNKQSNQGWIKRRFDCQKDTSVKDPLNCSPIAAKWSSFHTFEVSCLLHLSRHMPPFCMDPPTRVAWGQYLVVVSAVNMVRGQITEFTIFLAFLSRSRTWPRRWSKSITSPPSWGDNRSGRGVVWRQGYGCKCSRTPENTNLVNLYLGYSSSQLRKKTVVRFVGGWM